MEEHSKQLDGNRGQEQQGSQTDKLNTERDISTIDQQEGNLKNGELGGDLKTEQNTHKDQNKAPQ